MEILPHPPEVAVKRLLSDAKLLTEDITPEQLIHFFGCWSEDELVGVIGLKLYGDVALLRSGWLRVVARLNPLTYLVDALRELMIVGGESVHGYGVDFAVLFAVFIVLLMVAVRLYPTLVE